MLYKYGFEYILGKEIAETWWTFMRLFSSVHKAACKEKKTTAALI